MAIQRNATMGAALLLAVVAAVLPLAARDTTYGSPLAPGTTLQQGDVLKSGNGCMELHFYFADGYYNRLDLRGAGGDGCGSANWDSYSDFDWQGFGQGIHASSNEPRGMRAAFATMQEDGNFVVYDIQDGSPVPVWSTHTDGNPGAYLNVQDDGNLVIYSATNAVLWSLY
jgi:hypothetical protein